MKLHFSKYQGTGNDFVMIDNRNKRFPAGREVIAQMCRRRTGIGADGLILLEEDDTYDFAMRYFNADGGESTMCGNGGRCVIAFAHHLGLFKKRTVFRAVDGLHEGEIEGEWVRLKMNDVKGIRQIEEGYFLDTGSPHYVLFREDTEKTDVIAEGRQWRYSDLFRPEGTNVNFVQVSGPSRLYNRTYERGVEDETLSCGTGSIAAALTLAHTRQNVSSPVTVVTRGGTLKVHFRQTDTTLFTDIYLEGPATHVFDGEILIP